VPANTDFCKFFSGGHIVRHPRHRIFFPWLSGAVINLPR